MNGSHTPSTPQVTLPAPSFQQKERHFRPEEIYISASMILGGLVQGRTGQDDSLVLRAAYLATQLALHIEKNYQP